MLYFIVILLLVFFGQPQPNRDYSDVTSPLGTKVFEANWDSLANYKFPEWYRDAKLGIFIHWLVASVPAYGHEWYPRDMYNRGTDIFRHHVETYGPQDKFGMKDFIPLFIAEHFDSDEWARILVNSGAKYVVPVAEHHDGFALYNSDLNEWNSVQMGPKRDVIGELKASFEKAGLVFGLSNHRLENSWFYNLGLEFPSDVQDRSIALYGFRVADEAYTPEIGLDWLKHNYELIDKYQPRLVYFDWTVGEIPDYVNTYLAYYYNNAIDWNTDVVVNMKNGFPENIHVHDIERGKAVRTQQLPWQTCTSIGKRSWAYVEDEDNKTPQQIVHDLVDIVSKNGNLLLNIGPKADGTIAAEQQAVLAGLGAWLAVNGEAVYGTRPWTRFGEGSTATAGTSGSFSEGDEAEFGVGDIRFTTRGTALYAIVLAWGQDVLITSLTPEKVGSARLLGVTVLGAGEGSEPIQYEQTAAGLRVRLPAQKPCEYAYTIKLTFDTAVAPDFTVASVVGSGERSTALYPAENVVAGSAVIGPVPCADTTYPAVARALGNAAVGEWVEYTLDVQRAGIYRVYPRLCSSTDTEGKIVLFLDGRKAGEYTTVSTSTGPGVFTTVLDQSREMELLVGNHTLRLEVAEGAVVVDIIYFDFVQ